MCGIAGAVVLNGAAQSVEIGEGLRQLLHRGPDAVGVHSVNGAAIGQTRLAIIDLVTGDPPITNEDGSVGVALNGEIYNFRSLRERLEREGHRFATTGDTEVIAHLAEDAEPEALCRQLDGMFSFAVHDARRGRLLLGRDRFGKKPLYYWAGRDRFVFGSELKALFEDPSVPRRLDPGAIPAYLTFGYVPTPRSFFAGIHSVPPGHVLVLEADGEPQLLRYWEPPCAGANAEPLDLSLREAAAGIRSRLTDAVERRLVADVPIGAFLSGGIDSSAVVAIMATLLDRPVHTFAIGFEDRDWLDERPYARMVARRFRTQHEEFVVRPSAVDLIDRLIWHHDQPFGDSSALPTFLLSELTREHVTVALSGDGGDELFAGYERFGAALMVRYFQLLPRPLRELSRRSLNGLPDMALRGRVGSAQRFLARADMGLPDAYLSWLAYLPESLRSQLLPTPDDWALQDYRAIWAGSGGGELLNRLLDLNLRTYLLDDLLPKVDRMSMAHGLEVRSPFLDADLAGFALRLAPEMKIKGLRLKRVLKASIDDLVPRALLRRRKRGFGIPVDRWFRSDLRSYVDGTLGAPNARVREHLVGSALDEVLAAHSSGRRNHGHALWALLTLELFLRREGW
jgi:asparagine synthase (glutamine-hydrolysing)